MDDIRKVLVIGAGIGGLGAGAALASRGVDVEIVEIKPEANVYGVGINQPANSLRALKALGVLDRVRDVGFEWDTTKFHDHRGELVVAVPSQLGGDDVPSNTASRAATCTTSSSARPSAPARGSRTRRRSRTSTTTAP